MQKRQVQQAEGCLSVILRLFGVNGKQDSAQSLPYRRRESILTPAEHKFYKALIQAIDHKAVIIPKVGLQDVFFIIDKEHYQSARNRISTRHIDFLICESETLRPLFGIELDDSSHNKTETQKHDLFKNLVFEAALLPLARIRVKNNYDVNEIRAAIEPYFLKWELTNTPPICPNCKIPMVRKTARHGEFKGKDFYACPNYPTCKELKNIETA